jgi:hypothetical protein
MCVCFVHILYNLYLIFYVVDAGSHDTYTVREIELADVDLKVAYLGVK